MKWRDIITNAAQQAKLCSIQQQLPASLLQNGLTLLKERISQYSNTSFLEFARKSIDVEYNGKPITLGWYSLNDDYQEGTNFFTIYSDKDLPEATKELKEQNARAYDPNRPLTAIKCIQSGMDSYSWMFTRYNNKETMIAHMDCFSSYPDVLVKNIECVTRCYAMMTKECVNMKFVSFEDYDLFTSGSAVYTTIQRSNNIIEFATKYSQPQYRLIYNEKFSIDDLDDTLTIPDKWVTLFTTALVVDYARVYPRLSDNTYNILKDRLNEMEHNIKTTSSVNKFVGRYDYGTTIGYEAGLNGTFLL